MLKTGLFKKALSLLLSVLLLVSAFCITVQAMQPATGTLQSEPLSFYASPADSRSVLDYSGSFNIEAMTAELREYMLNYTLLVKLPGNSSLRIPATQENLNLIASIIATEIPEAFHFEYLQASFSTSDNLISLLTFNYNCTPDEYAQKMYACDMAAEKLLQGIEGNDLLTDVQKALLLHDRLALHCEYGDINGSYLDTATMYGALAGRRPVCQGYAIAYTYLLQRVGIESDMCNSDALNHAWNIVYIDDEAYHVDVTWDDPIYDITGRVYHNNFLLSTHALKNGISNGANMQHNANDFDTTPDDTKYDNAYWQNSETAFQLIDNELYYIDSRAGELRRDSDKAALADVNDMWFISNNGYYLVGNHARLAADAQYLYYNLSDAIYRYDPKTNSNELFYTPNMTQQGCKYYSVYGFSYQQGIMQFDLIDNNYNEYAYRFEIERCEHDYSIRRVLVAGDCTNPGLIRTTCRFCFAVADIMELDPTTHTGKTKYGNATEATCKLPGKEADLLCRDCGKVLQEGDVIPATGNHTWDEGVPEDSDICTGLLVYIHTCTVCGDTTQKTKETENTVHVGEIELRNAKAATCNTSGYTGDLCCTACDHVVTPGEVIPATENHAWDEGYVAIPPSMFAEGTHRYTCTVCGRTKDEDIPRLAESIKGDIDMDGNTTAADARLALRASVGFEELVGNAFIAANVDNDNDITAADARYILRYSVGLETEWPS